ncbi:MAG: hypothetical protein Q9190_006088 [Brigantiaea leucoxantha]
MVIATLPTKDNELTPVSTVEFNVGIICSCLPTLPALFRRNQDSPGSSSYVHHSSSNPAKTSDNGGTSKHGFDRIETITSQDSISQLEQGSGGGMVPLPPVRKGTGGGREKALEIVGLNGSEKRAREWFRQARV